MDVSASPYTCGFSPASAPAPAAAIGKPPRAVSPGTGGGLKKAVPQERYGSGYLSKVNPPSSLTLTASSSYRAAAAPPMAAPMAAEEPGDGTTDEGWRERASSAGRLSSDHPMSLSSSLAVFSVRSSASPMVRGVERSTPAAIPSTPAPYGSLAATTASAPIREIITTRSTSSSDSSCAMGSGGNRQYRGWRLQHASAGPGASGSTSIAALVPSAGVPPPPRSSLTVSAALSLCEPSLTNEPNAVAMALQSGSGGIGQQVSSSTRVVRVFEKTDADHLHASLTMDTRRSSPSASPYRGSTKSSSSSSINNNSGGYYSHAHSHPPHSLQSDFTSSGGASSPMRPQHQRTGSSNNFTVQLTRFSAGHQEQLPPLSSPLLLDEGVSTHDTINHTTTIVTSPPS